MHFLAQLILQEELKEYQISLSKLSPLKSIQKINLVKLLVFYYVIEASFSPEKNYATTNSLYVQVLLFVIISLLLKAFKSLSSVYWF